MLKLSVPCCKWSCGGGPLQLAENSFFAPCCKSISLCVAQYVRSALRRDTRDMGGPATYPDIECARAGMEEDAKRWMSDGEQDNSGGKGRSGRSNTELPTAANKERAKLKMATMMVEGRAEVEGKEGGMGGGGMKSAKEKGRRIR